MFVYIISSDHGRCLVFSNLNPFCRARTGIYSLPDSPWEDATTSVLGRTVLPDASYSGFRHRRKTV